jgi:hypothetical protein
MAMKIFLTACGLLVSLLCPVFAQDSGDVMDYSEMERRVAEQAAAVKLQAEQAGNDQLHNANATTNSQVFGSAKGGNTNALVSMAPIHKVRPPTVAFQVDKNGAIAQSLGHKVELDGNLNLADSITVTLPDSQVLQGHAVAIAFADESGKTEWLGLVKDCQGYIADGEASQILYPNAFAGLKADVRITYKSTYFEQDVILLENPRLPSGIDPNTARIEVWTEMFKSPNPVKWFRKVNQELNGRTVEKNDIERLQFGQMEMVVGRVFALPKTEPTPFDTTADREVQKRWVEQDGRVFLVESIALANIKTALAQLPLQTAAIRSQEKLPGKSARRMAYSPIKEMKPMEFALSESPVAAVKGVVLDYLLVNCSLMNVDFAAGASVTGPAAIGRGASDYWNLYYAPGVSDSSISNLKWSDSTASTVSVRVQNAPGGWCNYTGNMMYDSYSYTSGNNIIITIHNYPSGQYDIYVYGHGAADAQNAIYSINGVSKQTAVDACWNNNQLTNNAFVENIHYVVFRGVNITNGVDVGITCMPGSSSYVMINGLQIAGTINVAPTAYAGIDRTNRVHLTSILNGSISDDGFPVGSSLVATWSQISGPGQAVFSNVHSTNATVSFDTAGTYVLRLTASDSVLNASDEVVFSVLSDAGVGDSVERLLNINFASGSVKTGLAATGLTLSDYWNVYSAPYSYDTTVNNLKWSDNTSSSVGVRVQGAPGGWCNYTGDPMYDSYIYGSASNALVTIQNIPSGTWSMYLYGHGAADGQYSSFIVNGSVKSTAYGAYWNNDQLAGGGFIYNAHYVVYSNIVVSEGASLPITCVKTSAGYAVVNGLQLIKYATLFLNSPPTISHISDRTMITNVNTGLIDFTIGDLETTAGNLAVTATSSNPSFLPSENLIIGGSGATRSISLTEAPSAPGSSTITVSVSDGDYLTSTNFTLSFVAPTIRDPIAYWPLDDTSGSSAMDASGNQHTGVAAGSPYWMASSAVGVGLEFDGVDDQVTVANSVALQLTNTMSLAFWMKQTADTTGWTRIMGKGDNASRNYVVWIEGSPGRRILFQQGTNSAWQSLLSQSAIPSGAWTHVAVTVQNLAASVYINGQLNSSTNFTQAAPISSAPFTMGYYDANFAPYPGILADVRLYNVALTAAEIQTLQSAVYKADFDGDGLADGWERKYFGNLSQDGTGDYNGDGFSNAEAFSLGFSPLTTIVRDVDGSVTKTKVFSVRPE